MPSSANESLDSSTTSQVSSDGVTTSLRAALQSPASSARINASTAASAGARVCAEVVLVRVAAGVVVDVGDGSDVPQAATTSSAPIASISLIRSVSPVGHVELGESRLAAV